MGLLIVNEALNFEGFSRQGIYIQIVPIVRSNAGNDGVVCSVRFWKDKADFQSNPDAPTINFVDEIPAEFLLPGDAAPANNEQDDILKKFIFWTNDYLRTMILEKNPSWNPDNVSII